MALDFFAFDSISLLPSMASCWKHGIDTENVRENAYLPLGNMIYTNCEIRCVKMRLAKETRAISSIFLILIIVCSLIVGGLVTYLFVMANFYAEPEDTVDLAITNVNFPVDHADHFDITVLNPSHSPSDTNITDISFSVTGNQTLFAVTETSPQALPIPLERAKSINITCTTNWGEFAGRNITVHVNALSGSGAVYTVQTQLVDLEISPKLNATESTKYFNMTVRNLSNSAINLSLTKIYFDMNSVENLTRNGTSISLPRTLAIGESLDLQCFYDWQGHTKPLIRVETAEGYSFEVRETESSNVDLSVVNVTFNETSPDTDKINILISNANTSDTSVDITDIALTDENGTTYHINETLATPNLPYSVDKNTSATFECAWLWTNYRNKNVTVTAYTKQGFVSTNKTVTTPPAVIFAVTGEEFNLNQTGFFLVNVTNMPSSLQSINITQIKLDGVNVTGIDPASEIIPIGEWRQFNCTFDWASLRGTDVTITVTTEDNLTTSATVHLPSVDLVIVDATFGMSTGIPYANITILNSVFSTRNVTITQIAFATGNVTENADGNITNPLLYPTGYVLTKDANVTISCPWNWLRFPDQNLTITVYTAEGFSASLTIQIPEYVP